MPRLQRFLVTILSLFLMAAIGSEFTPLGPIGRWLEGQPYPVFSAGGYDLFYHGFYLLAVAMSILVIIALLTKERIAISNWSPGAQS